MFFYTYVLQSLKDGQHYIGWTNQLEQRLAKHRTGKVPATRNRRPFQLVYLEVCRNKEKAIAREKYFKSGFGRRFLKDRI